MILLKLRLIIVANNLIPQKFLTSSDFIKIIVYFGKYYIFNLLLRKYS